MSKKHTWSSALAMSLLALLATEEVHAKLPNPAAITSQQQQQEVSGVITDASTKEPLIGASVVVKGTTTGNITDFDGNFSVKAKKGDILIISYMGYKPLEKIVTQTGTMNIQLQPDNELLEEVVVVGYNTQKKESLTGAMQVIKNEDLTTITTPSVENMLNGKLPGVYVASGSGQPGAAGAVVIRGKASINGNSAPLWVIDGVIVGNGAGALNPEDIESMTVLKDAASTAIYGSEGANGVIVVTTKRAGEGDIKINFNTRLGVSTLNNGNLEMMDGAQLYDYYSSFSNADQIAFPRWNEDLRNSNFDWWDVATQTGFVQDHNLSLSGGNDKVKTYFSAGVYDENGAVKGYDLTQYNFRMKVDYKPYKWLTIRPSVYGARKDIKDQQYSTTAMYSMFPWDSPYDEDGNLVPHRYEGWVNSQQTNYIYDLQWNKSSSMMYEFNGNFDFDVKLTDWLTFASTNNYRTQDSRSKGYTDPRSNGGSGVEGRISNNSSRVIRRYTSQILRFNKLFGKHAINGILGYEFRDYHYETTEAIGIGFVPGFEILDVTAQAEKVAGGISQWANQSVMFNAHYAYDNKYLAQILVRRDGASNFGDSAKYSNFFSISGAWNINREKWFKADWVDQLKLRAAYGTVGNKPSSLYPQYDLYSISKGASYNAESGALISQIGNRDFTWEQTYTTSIGADVAMFGNRLRSTIDYYRKDTKDVIFNVPVSGTTGVTSIWKNVGEIVNNGIEFTIGGDIIQSKDWIWSVDVNLAHNNNKITKLYGDDPNMEIVASDGLGIAGTADKLLKVGESSDSFYLREWAGVNPENGAPQWYKTVTLEDGTKQRVATEKYAEADRVITGESTPTVFGGFSTNLTYKRFDLNANFGFSLGGKIYNYARMEYDSDGTYTDRNQMVLQDGWTRWEKPGDVATHPVATYNNKSQANKASTRYLEDGDYLKLRSLSIGYNVPLKRFQGKNLRVYLAGENLFTITEYSGVDPEIPASNGAVLGSTGPGVYPSVRKYVFGLNLTF